MLRLEEGVEVLVAVSEHVAVGEAVVVGVNVVDGGPKSPQLRRNEKSTKRIKIG
jgi:hypothetical protein